MDQIASFLSQSNFSLRESSDMGPAHIVAEKSVIIVEWLHDELGLTYEDIGTLLGTSGRTVQRWKDQDTLPSRENLRKLEKVDELRFWLATVFGDDTERMHRWLATRLLDLRGRTPLEAIREGETERIIEFLATFHEGAFI
jgi:transcriptional regulator with XRE-family HTH domain